MPCTAIKLLTCVVLCRLLAVLRMVLPQCCWRCSYVYYQFHNRLSCIHFILQDPFPKPCYLFALVAGDLVVKQDNFKTMSGRDVTLRIYTQPQSIDQVDWAMESLEAAMKWDEETYGLEYDLVSRCVAAQNCVHVCCYLPPTCLLSCWLYRCVATPHSV